MHRLFADVPPRFPKPREKQFLATVIVSRLTKLAGKGEAGPGDCLPGPEETGTTQDAGSSGGAGYTSISGQYQVGGKAQEKAPPRGG